jgi:hypothetical protein
MIPVVSGLDELTDGVGVGDVDPVGEDADSVGVAVEEVLVASGLTSTWGYLGSAISDPAWADCSEAAKTDVVSAAGAVAFL